MGKQKRQYRKAAVCALTAAMTMSSFFAAGVSAEETETMELQELLELTSPELETEEGSAASARLKIGDWLDYGDYGIERTDVPGTTYQFTISTKDENDNPINDQQMAFCIQSYFLTPLPGDHTIDMTDNVTSVNGGRNLHKTIYYGYGGAGYDAAEFEAFLEQTNPEYFADVYANLNDEEKEELSYILTHSAASYAYFNDGTDFKRFLELQFEIKYGDAWEENLGYFIKADVAKAEAAAGDLNLFGSTYGMNSDGITLAKAWYDVLTAKKDPQLGVSAEDGVYTFKGNEKNAALELSFAVPQEWICDVTRADGTTQQALAGEQVVLVPTDTYTFTYTGEAVSDVQGGLDDADVPVSGALKGADNEIWNLIVLETNKGTNATVSKRQQDIASLTLINEGKTELDFTVEAPVEAITVSVADEAGAPIEGAAFGVFYDAECSVPVQKDGAAAVITTDDAGEAYLEYIAGQKLAENGGSLYVKQESTPTGYVADEEVYNIGGGQSAEITNEYEDISVSGSVSWNVPEGTELPESVTVNLQQNGEVIDTKDVSAAEDWTYEWSDLQKYNLTEESAEAADIPALYEYTAEADPVDGYVTVSDGMNVISTITGMTELSGEIVWHDADDADALRPESITVELSRAGQIADTEEVSAEDDWAYAFTDLDLYSEDGTEAYEYTVDVQVPEGYTVVNENGQLIVTHAASAEAVIELMVELAGRALKEGDFVFDLVQVTDAAGTAEAEDGLTASAVNDADGKVAFEGVTITEPGTYYYQITGKPAKEGGAIEADPVTYVAQIDAVAGGEFGDQIETAVKFVDAEGNEIDPAGMQIEAVYRASGEAEIGEVSIVLENGELQEGQFEVQLLDAEGTVLQTKTNDADGKVGFDAIAYTQDDIGTQFVYTITQTDKGEEGVTYDDTSYTVKVKVEDSEDGDGTLNITQEEAAVVFANTYTAPETEAPTEEVTEVPTEEVTEAATEKVTEEPTEAPTEKVTEEPTEAPTEKVTEEPTEAPTEKVTEEPTEAATEKVTEAEAEEASAEPDEAKEMNAFTIVIPLSLIVLIILFILRMLKRRK